MTRQASKRPTRAPASNPACPPRPALDHKGSPLFNASPLNHSGRSISSTLTWIFLEGRVLRCLMVRARVPRGGKARMSFRRPDDEDQTAQQGKDLFEPEAEMGDEERFGRPDTGPHEIDEHELPDPLSPDGGAQDRPINHDRADKQDVEDAYIETMHSHSRAEIHEARAEVRHDSIPHRSDNQWSLAAVGRRGLGDMLNLSFEPRPKGNRGLVDQRTNQLRFHEQDKTAGDQDGQEGHDGSQGPKVQPDLKMQDAKAERKGDEDEKGQRDKTDQFIDEDDSRGLDRLAGLPGHVVKAITIQPDGARQEGPEKPPDEEGPRQVSKGESDSLTTEQ